MDVYRACGILHGTEPGEPDNRPLSENAPLRTQRPPYSRETFESLKKTFTWLEDDYDKIPVERVVMAEPRLPGTVLRLPMVYGPGDPLHRLYPLLKRIDDGRPAILLEESQAGWRGPRGYVENVAQGIALAATNERAGGRIYNVAEPEAFSELEWTRRVAEATDWPGRVRVLPAERMPSHLRLPYNFRQHWVPDTGRIRSELGYRESVPFEEGLRRTIAWERAHPPERYLWAQFDYPAEDAALGNP